MKGLGELNTTLRQSQGKLQRDNRDLDRLKTKAEKTVLSFYSVNEL